MEPRDNWEFGSLDGPAFLQTIHGQREDLGGGCIACTRVGIKGAQRVIYRILADCKVRHWDEGTRVFKWIPGHLVGIPRMRGGFFAMLNGFDLTYPDIENPRARFYFTERGWREVGRKVVALAKQEGHVIRVVRRKDPAPSQIVYRDDFQVAILPGRAKQESS